jgi:NAD-dependent DNA ligase
MEHINKFKYHGISAIEKLNESELNTMIVTCKDTYYNSTPIISDNLYDILADFTRQKYPESKLVDTVGAPIYKNKVKLPYEMWSMDKIKPDTNALANWKQKFKGKYVISCKLDGVSGLYDCISKPPKLYTRGDGKVGQDISHLIPFLNLPKISNIVARGEFIIKKKLFNAKYKNTFANPRNMVSGLVNKQTYDENMYDIDFVVYELISKTGVKPSEQMFRIIDYGFNSVKNETINKSELTNEKLSSILLNWRTNYEYEIDGIIVSDDNVYERKTGNPEHSFAFKMVLSDQVAEANVIDVLWEPSKDGYLKPRVRIEPINLGGVKIEYATGFNGKFIEDNKIGIGALIQIIRSGDVIPHIKSVSMPAQIPKMPEQSYVWNDTHVDVLLEDIDSDTVVALKNISAFFISLGVEGLAKGNIKRLIDAGYNSVPKIIQAKKSDFEIVGFKTLADKFVKNIKDKLDNASLIDIMVASNKLGRGISNKTIEVIINHYPNILKESLSDGEKYIKLIEIKGIGEVNAKTFIKNIPNFLKFLKDCGLENKLQRQNQNQNHKTTEEYSNHFLHNKKIVMTKVRDKDIIEKMKEVGGIIQDTVNSETFVLIVKSKDDNSSKMQKAKDKNIPILTPEEFKNSYFYI